MPAQKEYLVKIKKQGHLHQYTYEHSPLAVKGWDGFLWPYAFSIHDFEPITGRVHLPPPIHQTFETDAFVVCSFCPRLYDYHPQAIPAPYNHSNIDSDEVLYYVGLGEARYRNVETYSTGMKQRIKLAQALVHDPDLLFLDEPTNGMDPKGRDEMLALIDDLAHHKGVNLIVSSHLLPDIEHTCDHVIVMDKGTVATQGALDAVRGPQGRVFELRLKDGAARMVALLTDAGCECHDTDEDVMRVFVPGEGGAEVIFRLASTHGLQVRHLRQSTPTLEDAFARAVGAE